MADFGSVALLRKDDDLHIMPLIGPDAGGYLIKQINARGDRAIHAADFFRLNGVDNSREIYCEGEWRAGLRGYVLSRLFAPSTGPWLFSPRPPAPCDPPRGANCALLQTRGEVGGYEQDGECSGGQHAADDEQGPSETRCAGPSACERTPGAALPKIGGERGHQDRPEAQARGRHRGGRRVHARGALVAGVFHDQDGVLCRERDEQDDACLGVEGCLAGRWRRGRRRRPRRVSGTARMTARG